MNRTARVDRYAKLMNVEYKYRECEINIRLIWLQRIIKLDYFIRPGSEKQTNSLKHPKIYHVDIYFALPINV